MKYYKLAETEDTFRTWIYPPENLYPFRSFRRRKKAISYSDVVKQNC